MNIEALTTTEAAEALGVPKTTLKTWVDRLPIPMEKDSRGRRLLGEQGIALLQQVKALREVDNGYETIRRRIEWEPAGSLLEPTEGRPAPGYRTAGDGDEADLESAPGRPVDAEALIEAVTEAIANQTDMAERYGRAAHRIGELEATVKALEGEHLRLAEGASQVELLRFERERMIGELAAVERDRERLARELAEERARREDMERAHREEMGALATAKTHRPWWKVWG